jgi:hypothetical protein
MKALLTVALLTLGTFTAREAVQSTNKLDQHEWLQQLVGEWSLSSEAIVEPGSDATTWESKESIRAIGALWIVAETTAETDGEAFTSLLTVGYDPRKETFVGSWIDTLQTTMWSYVGQLDEAQRILTLEAEGPSLTDAGKTGKYRDRIEFVSPDHKRTTSTALGDDGNWTVFMTVDARRVK